MRMEQHAEKLFKESDVLLIEEFLGGEEITVAVLPPGTYSVSPITENLFMQGIQLATDRNIYAFTGTSRDSNQALLSSSCHTDRSS